jgi:hypothetical protein
VIPTADEINAMTDADYKRWEQRLRREAARQGYRLEKSRARDTYDPTKGTYRLMELPSDRNNFSHYTLAAADHNSGYGLGLDDVVRFLSESEPNR